VNEHVYFQQRSACRGEVRNALSYILSVPSVEQIRHQRRAGDGPSSIQQTPSAMSPADSASILIRRRAMSIAFASLDLRSPAALRILPSALSSLKDNSREASVVAWEALRKVLINDFTVHVQGGKSALRKESA
jgi:hypothetical protein